MNTNSTNLTEQPDLLREHIDGSLTKEHTQTQQFSLQHNQRYSRRGRRSIGWNSRNCWQSSDLEANLSVCGCMLSGCNRDRQTAND
jgi:hypothetical protein